MRIDITQATQAQVAAVFGVKRQAVAQWNCPRQPDGRYVVKEVVHWYIQKERDKASDRITEVLVEEGAALERQQRLRGDLLELDKEERLRILCRTDPMRELLARLSVIVRGCGDKLRRKYDNRAGEILEGALDIFEREVEQYFGSTTKPE